jgi:hypothetical protein
LTFAGKPYDPEDQAQRNALLDTLIGYAGTFVFLRLLERRRQITPPSLGYRLTPLGRRIGNWGYGSRPGFRKRAFFFGAGTFLRAYNYRVLFAVGEAGWAVLNAIKFYSAALSWVGGLPFAAWSAAVVAAIVGIWALIKSRLS